MTYEVWLLSKKKIGVLFPFVRESYYFRVNTSIAVVTWGMCKILLLLLTIVREIVVRNAVSFVIL